MQVIIKECYRFSPNMFLKDEQNNLRIRTDVTFSSLTMSLWRKTFDHFTPFAASLLGLETTIRFAGIRFEDVAGYHMR